MSGLATTGSYFSEIIGRVSPAVSGVSSVLTNPYFYGIVLTLLLLSLIPGTDN